MAVASTFGRMNSSGSLQHKDREELQRERRAEMEKNRSKIRYPHGELVDLPIDRIQVNPLNREIFTISNIGHLASLIEERGFKSTISVYDTGEDKYLLFSGERRLTAVKKLGYTTVQAIIYDAPESKSDEVEDLLGANFGAREMTPMQYARGIDIYIKGVLTPRGIKQPWKHVSQFFNMSVANAKRYHSLLKLDPKLQAFCEYQDFPWSSIAKYSFTEEETEKLYQYISSNTVVKMKEEDDASEEEVIEVWITRNDISAFINEMRGKNPPVKMEEESNDDKTETIQPSTPISSDIVSFDSNATEIPSSLFISKEQPSKEAPVSSSNTETEQSPSNSGAEISEDTSSVRLAVDELTNTMERILHRFSSLSLGDEDKDYVIEKLNSFKKAIDSVIESL